MEDGVPSVTARRVAAYRLGFDRVTADYGDPAADDALTAGLATGQAVQANRMHDYLAARTRFFDQVVVGAIDRGVRQVVVGAAGYDGRAFRYAKPGTATAGTATAESVRRPASSSPAAPREPQPPQRQLPLSALLSQALVAFTIECDNEAEHRAPHRTTDHGPSGHGDGVWLTSLVMWENCMRYVTDEPITVAELLARARTGTNLDGMRRWGYITIDGTARKIYSRTPGQDAVLRATADGLRARQIWPPLPGLIERRWRDRFGPQQVGRLRNALVTVVGQLDPALPDCLPILGAALLSRGPDPALPPRPQAPGIAALPLSALLSRVLLSFAVDYEQETGRSLAVGANVLRVLTEAGTRPRDLPALTGTAKAAVSWTTGILTRTRLAVEEPDPAASRGKIVRLTPAGLRAQRVYHEVTRSIEQRWHDRFAQGAITALRAALEPLTTAPGGGPPPLFEGLEPYSGNWRASVRRPDTMPHYPMVLHRGGYPDGS